MKKRIAQVVRPEFLITIPVRITYLQMDVLQKIVWWNERPRYEWVPPRMLYSRFSSDGGLEKGRVASGIKALLKKGMIEQRPFGPAKYRATGEGRKRAEWALQHLRTEEE